MGEEGDTEKPSTSLSASRLTFALSTGSRRVCVKHLASLTPINMVAQVSQQLYHILSDRQERGGFVSVADLRINKCPFLFPPPFLFFSFSLPPPLPPLLSSLSPSPSSPSPSPLSLLDGLDLYPINPLNPAIFPEERNYMCGHWLVEYEKIHSGTYVYACLFNTTW